MFAEIQRDRWEGGVSLHFPRQRSFPSVACGRASDRTIEVSCYLQTLTVAAKTWQR
jgi:hypothetical protein